ncbi:hypothetical protein C1H46_008904 [Malus baccata]|uniref:Uncharacterized protein n=1 Tax=Malus baccata TaxID=106549 RepID=A0A540N390_MALBA|nr:hypothetical protein C1H46_008904 [Malus baccata]
MESGKADRLVVQANVGDGRPSTLGQNKEVVVDTKLMSGIPDLNEMAHDDDLVDTSMAIIPCVDINDVLTGQQEGVNELRRESIYCSLIPNQEVLDVGQIMINEVHNLQRANEEDNDLMTHTLAFRLHHTTDFIGAGHPTAPFSIQEGVFVRRTAGRASTDWSLGSYLFNLDHFIFGHSDTMQGRVQHNVKLRGRGKKRTKGEFRKLPNLGNRHTRERGMLGDYAAK